MSPKDGFSFWKTTDEKIEVRFYLPSQTEDKNTVSLYFSKQTKNKKQMFSLLLTGRESDSEATERTDK